MALRVFFSTIVVLVLAGVAIAQTPPQGVGSNVQRGNAAPPARGAQDARGAAPGGWIPATTRVNSFALYGKKVPR